MSESDVTSLGVSINTDQAREALRQLRADAEATDGVLQKLEDRAVGAVNRVNIRPAGQDYPVSTYAGVQDLARQIGGMDVLKGLDPGVAHAIEAAEQRRSEIGASVAQFAAAGPGMQAAQVGGGPQLYQAFSDWLRAQSQSREGERFQLSDQFETRLASSVARIGFGAAGRQAGIGGLGQIGGLLGAAGPDALLAGGGIAAIAAAVAAYSSGQAQFTTRAAQLTAATAGGSTLLSDTLLKAVGDLGASQFHISPGTSTTLDASND